MLLSWLGQPDPLLHGKPERAPMYIARDVTLARVAMKHSRICDHLLRCLQEGKVRYRSCGAVRLFCELP